MNIEQGILVLLFIVIVAIFRDYLIGLVKTIVFAIVFYFVIIGLCFFAGITLTIIEDIAIGIVEFVVVIGLYSYDKLIA